MNPHYNYRPAAGSVIDQNEPRATWDGGRWLLGGRPYNVPSSHRLIGRPGGPLNGWYYDWRMRAWIEPTPSQPKPTQPRPQQAQPRPTQPQPTQPQQTPANEPEKKECDQMEKKPQNVLEDLVKHPIAPLLGGVLMVASYVTDEPSPPTLPDGLPEPVAKQWQMVFNQNQQRFERRMSMYRDLGMVLLGYSSARSITDVIGSREHRALPKGQ